METLEQQQLHDIEKALKDSPQGLVESFTPNEQGREVKESSVLDITTAVFLANLRKPQARLVAIDLLLWYLPLGKV